MSSSQTPPKVVSYLSARERFLVARAKYYRHEEFLKDLLGASDTGADLERAMLEARTKGIHAAAITKLSTLGTDLDKASGALELATELQRRKVAMMAKEGGAALDQTFRNLDE